MKDLTPCDCLPTSLNCPHLRLAHFFYLPSPTHPHPAPHNTACPLHTRPLIQPAPTAEEEDENEAEQGEAFLDVADDADDFADEEDEEAAEEHLRQRLAEGDFDLDLEEPADPDEHTFRSPLDDVDELVRYCDALRALQEGQPKLFQHLMESLCVSH